MRSLASMSVLVLLIATSTAASAGETKPVSALPMFPTPVPLKVPESMTSVPGLTVKSKDVRAGHKWIDLSVSTSRGYCLRFGDEVSISASRGTTGASAPEDLEVLRFIEKDSEASLERVRFRFQPSTEAVEVQGRSRVDLREVARSAQGVTVWGFREGADVYLLARAAQSGIAVPKRSDDDGGGERFLGSDCTFGLTRLTTNAPAAGTIAQLSGNLPPRGEGKSKVSPHFTIDASVSRLSRDPEPMLAVRIRVKD